MNNLDKYLVWDYIASSKCPLYQILKCFVYLFRSYKKALKK